MPTMTMHYEPDRAPQDALRVRLPELAGSRVRYDYRRLTVLLKREAGMSTRNAGSPGKRLFLAGVEDKSTGSTAKKD